MTYFDDPNREAVGLPPITAGGEGTQPAVPSPGGFDPSGHTVADVQAYLADHPDETDAVLALERQGKNRASLVGEA